ncbi:MAG: ParB/Srx family N-terminal domain-containing protein [Hyphomicrobium sp.]|nr:ParB/Srx family N-terminal domain-containing protein [Hyphomicrobium sp.]
MRHVNTLTPYARNAKQHPVRQVKQIAASIKEFGFTIPILVDELGVIIAGHGRLLAANMLNLTHVPVMTATGWSEAQKRAYVLADNQLTANGAWDKELLKLEMDDLKESGFDTGLLGFGKDGLERVLNPDKFRPAPDVLEELNAVIITCADEAEQLKVMELLLADGIPFKAAIG